MTGNADITIGEATRHDYPTLLAMNEDAVPHVNSIPLKKLAHLHRESVYLGVARAGGEVAGYLLALTESADYDSLNFGWFKRNYPRFVYVDRIIVHPGFRRAGIGAALYSHLEEQAGRLAPWLTCEVNLRPPNATSLAFHKRLGFEPVGEQDTEGGSKRVCLMAKPLPGPA